MFLSEKAWLNLKPAPQAPQSVTAYPTLTEDSQVLGSGLDQVNQFSGYQYGVKPKSKLNDTLNQVQLS